MNKARKEERREGRKETGWEEGEEGKKEERYQKGRKEGTSCLYRRSF